VSVHLPMPRFRKIGGKHFCLEHEALACVAEAFGLPPPPQPETVKLRTPGEYAEMIRCSIHTMRKEITRQARLAAATPDEASDRAA
jgi:hypothetical protein